MRPGKRAMDLVLARLSRAAFPWAVIEDRR